MLIPADGEMEFEYRIHLQEEELYPTPFRLPEGCYIVGVQGENASTVGVLVALRDGRTQFNQLIKMQGEDGLTFILYHIPAGGQELSGMRVQAVRHSRETEDGIISATIFCRPMYSNI